MSPVFADGKEYPIAPQRTIFDYADSLEVRVPTACGRNGECHECVVEIKKGMEALSQLTEEEGQLAAFCWVLSVAVTTSQIEKSRKPGRIEWSG